MFYSNKKQLGLITASIISTSVIAVTPHQALAQNANAEHDIHIGEAPSHESAEDVFMRSIKTMLKPKEMRVDLNFSYRNQEEQQFVPVAGGTLQDNKVETYTTSIKGQIGLGGGSQLYISIPYHQTYKYTSFTQPNTGEIVSHNASNSDFGDTTIGFTQTVLKENIGIPHISLDANATISDDVQAFGLGINLVKSFDPVTLFGGISGQHATRTLENSSEEISNNSYSILLGYAFNINDTVTLGSKFDGSFTEETRTAAQSDNFGLEFSVTTMLTEKLSFEPYVRFGLDGSASDVTMGVRTPFTISF